MFGDLENGGQAAVDHVDQLFKMSQKGWLMKRLQK